MIIMDQPSDIECNKEIFLYSEQFQSCVAKFRSSFVISGNASTT